MSSHDRRTRWPHMVLTSVIIKMTPCRQKRWRQTSVTMTSLLNFCSIFVTYGQQQQQNSLSMKSVPVKLLFVLNILTADIAFTHQPCLAVGSVWGGTASSDIQFCEKSATMRVHHTTSIGIWMLSKMKQLCIDFRKNQKYPKPVFIKKMCIDFKKNQRCPKPVYIKRIKDVPNRSTLKRCVLTLGRLKDAPKHFGEAVGIIIYIMSNTYCRHRYHTPQKAFIAYIIYLLQTSLSHTTKELYACIIYLLQTSLSHTSKE